MSKQDNGSEIPIEFKEYIFFKFGTYAVKNDKNRKLITFGRFSSKDAACAAVGLLIKYDWNIIDVSNNPIYNYLNEFWVFKVMNNTLIFDRKFSSFEQAVEYVEINTKCNDYNNDILFKKKRKSRFADLPKNTFNEDLNIPNIYSKDGVFAVKYASKGKEYGVFKSIDEAIVAKNLLIENNWKFSSSVEIKFYNSYYWIFKIENNVLTFIDKFESYEDALDCLDSNNLNDESEGLDFGKSIKKINKEYVEEVKKESYEIEDNFKKSISPDSKLNFYYMFGSSLDNNISLNTKKNSINKQKQPTSKKKKRKINRFANHYYIPKVKHNLNRDNIKIENLESISKEHLKIEIKNLKSELNIIQFKDNVLSDYYSIYFSDEGEIEFSNNIDNLKEFKYVFGILVLYGFDLDRINKLSSIHYINNSYYIIKSFNEKLIISESFSSYSEAEDNIKFLFDYYSKEVPQTNIKKHGDYYKYIGEHETGTFEISYQKSLETLKAIIDICDYYMWDPLLFVDYNIYYYHGLYWEFDYFNYYIKLTGRFYSKEDAIKHKITQN